MDKYLYIGLGVAVIGIILYQIINSEKQRRAKLLYKIKQAWGNPVVREYEYDEFEALTHYYKKRKKEGEFVIDDITWNDLDMDSVFLEINNTQSSTGAEYLYKMLRTPCFDKKTLEERDRLMEYFTNNEDIRISYQLDLAKIGQTKKFALVDYIENFVSLKKGSNVGHYLQIALVVMSIVLMSLNPAIGIVALISSLIYNVFTYYKEKGKVEPFFVCIGAAVRLVDCCERLGKHNEKELEQYLVKIREIAKSLKSIRKDVSYIGSTDKLSGNPADIIMDYIRMLFHIDLIKFNNILGKVQNEMGKIDEAMEILGELEAIIAIASYRKSIAYYCKPVLKEGKNVTVNMEDIYHPLISNPVPNTIKENRSVLLTGSNASGKSTFLKTVAINAILAQTIYTVLGNYYETNFYQVYSSMALKDNLQGNESYYMVEIKSLKRIMDADSSKYPILCFVDEVLRGTNTVERIAASSRILLTLAKSGAMCFAATHDIELTHLLEENYSNYHFQEEIEENDVLFNYQLFKGRATTRNAIKLLAIMGYDTNVIEQAEETAQRFLNEGVWKL